MRKAILSARQELESIESLYKQIGWDSAVGSSGTLLAISEVLHEQQWTNGEITRDGLSELREALVAAPRDSSLDIEFPSDWLRDHPLTEADLAQEVSYLEAANFKLRYK